MQTDQSNKKSTKSAKKYLEDKNFLRAYLRGEIGKAELNERGIKLAMPL